MIVGMTGRRDGMTVLQRQLFTSLLKHLKADELHHGDCLGADSNAHDIGRELGLKIIVHPPIKEELRAFCKGDEIREPDNYFARNRHIVNASEVLIGTPATAYESRGGTWYTINYGKRVGKPVYILYPDGSFDRPRGYPKGD